jgi:hypothetical protein
VPKNRSSGLPRLLASGSGTDALLLVIYVFAGESFYSCKATLVSRKLICCIDKVHIFDAHLSWFLLALDNHFQN